MRGLTEAEARVIGALLGSASDSERDRLRRTGLPRSTYHNVRRRVYAEGWVRDRYFPHPAFFRLTHVTVILGRPFADRVDHLLDRWQAERNNPVIFASAQLALGVFFHHSAREATSTLTRLVGPSLMGSSFSVTADLANADVPVYFDFEGFWAHLVGVTGLGAYPRGLGGGMDRETSLPPRWQWAMHEILTRPEQVGVQAAPSHLLGPERLPRSQRILVDRGWASHRVIPDLRRIPAYQERRADQVVFVTGGWEASQSPAQLLSVLTSECRAFPFLMVRESDRLLIGLVGQSGQPPSGTRGLEHHPRPIFPTLQQYLANIEVIQDAAQHLVPRNDFLGAVFLSNDGARPFPNPLH